MEDTLQLHYPGSEYLGPGTHIITKILKQIKPTSYVDALALRHDIEYLQDGEALFSDIRAAKQADTSIQGVLMKIGLVSRTAIDLFLHVFGKEFHLNRRPPKLTQQQYQFIKDRARPMLEEYGVADDYIVI